MKKRTPDFENNLLRVFNKKKPERATLFEFAMDGSVYCAAVDRQPPEWTPLSDLRFKAEAMANLGYDYVSCQGSNFRFYWNNQDQKNTLSINEGMSITDWESFEKFEWPNMDHVDYSALEDIKPYLPDGMKIMITGPDGVLENVIRLVGYDNLCIMLFEEPELVKALFENVGSRLLKYYETAVEYDTVGFLCSNDDWGFNTQTLLSPADLRKYVFPWHKKIVEAAHSHGKPCILHSCGYFNDIIDDIIDDLKFDARHSYEDNIVPVEQAYERLNGRIAVIGGIDINYLCTHTPEEVYTRSREMLERTSERGGYALGSGNSIPKYIPFENYLAMVRAAHDFE